MVSIDLFPARESQLLLLKNLWQLYSHDFADYLDDPVNEQGLFPYDYDHKRYFEKSGFWPYIARVGGRIAGFSLVSDRVMQRPGPGRYIDDFFILRQYRRQGVGRSIAFQTFDTYQGYWEVSEIGPNKPAQAFWRQVLKEYTVGRYVETSFTEQDGIEIILQRFDSASW
jgi:predicted acetyltransferase